MASFVFDNHNRYKLFVVVWWRWRKAGSNSTLNLLFYFFVPNAVANVVLQGFVVFVSSSHVFSETNDPGFTHVTVKQIPAMCFFVSVAD